MMNLKLMLDNVLLLLKREEGLETVATDFHRGLQQRDVCRWSDVGTIALCNGCAL